MQWFGRGTRHSSDADLATIPSPEMGAMDIERRAAEIGRDLLRAARRQHAGVFSGRFWSDQLMNWAMKDPAFKVQLFRFIDVFPDAPTPATGARVPGRIPQPAGRDAAAGHGTGAQGGRLGQGAAGQDASPGGSRALAGNFIAGADAASALPELEKLWKRGVAFSVDLLGEACVSDEEARAYQQRYLDLIETSAGGRSAGGRPIRCWRPTISARCRERTFRSRSARLDPRGPIAIDFEGSLRALTGVACGRFWKRRPATRCSVNFDMEQFALKDLTVDAVRALLRGDRFSGRPGAAGVSAQRHGRRRRIDRLGAADRPASDGAADQGRLLGLRSGPCRADGLARARLDRQTPKPTPVSSGWPSVCVAADAASGRARAASNWPSARTTSVRSPARWRCWSGTGCPPSAVEVQMLYGMAEPLQAGAGRPRGLRVREYVPLGEMIPAWPIWCGGCWRTRRTSRGCGRAFSTSSDEAAAGLAARAERAAVRRVNTTATTGGPTAGTTACTSGRRDRGRPTSRPFAGRRRPRTTDCRLPTSRARDFAQAAAARAIRPGGGCRRSARGRAMPAMPKQARQAVARAAAALPAWRDLDPLERSRMIVRGGRADAPTPRRAGRRS